MAEISHKLAKRYILEAADRLLSERQKHTLEEHLDICAECRQYQMEIDSLQAKIRKALYVRAASGSNRLPARRSVYSAQDLYNQMKRGVRMQTIQRTAYLALGLLILAAVVFGGSFLVKRLVPAPTPAGEATQEIPPTQTGNQEEAPVTITFADFGGFQAQYEPLIAAFHEQNPKITVQFVPLQAEPGQIGLASQADVLVLPQMPLASESYTYLDLDPLLASDPILEAEDFWPGLLSACQIQERTYGLPLYVEPSLIFYDGAAFDQAGLARPAPGWSWDDFRNAASLLSQQADRYGFAGSPMALFLLQIDGLLQENGGKVDASRLESGLGWYVELVQAGKLFQFGGDTSPQDWEEVITNNRAAMWIEGLYALSNRQQQLGSDIGVVPYPVDGGETSASLVSRYCAAISSGSQNPKAAWTLLQFLTRKAVPTRVHGSVPARESVAQSSGFWETLDEKTEAAVRFALEHGWYGSEYSEIAKAVSTAIEQAAGGKEDLGELLAAITPGEAVAQPVPAPTPVVVAPPPTEAPEQIPEGATVVEYFTDSSNQDSNVVKHLAEEFNNNQSDIYVRVIDNTQAFGFDGFDSSKIIERFDCYLGFVPPDQIEKVYSLDSLIDGDLEGMALTEEIPAPFWSSVRMNGSIYGLPAASSPYVIYYNKDHFAQQGLEPPAIGWTMDDFWSMASAASTDGVYGFVPVEDYLFLFPEEGTKLFDLSVLPPQISFDTPETLQVVRMLAEQVKNGGMPMIVRTGYGYFGNGSTGYSLIHSGKAAMWTFRGGFRYGDYEDHGYEVGVLPLPGETGLLNPDGVRSIIISRHTEDPSGCWKWAKYVSGHSEAFYGIPVRQSVLASPDFEAAVGAEAAAAYRAVMSQPYLEPVPVERQWQYPAPPLGVLLSNALYAIFNGSDPVPALAELQRQAEVYFECIGQASVTQEDPLYYEKVEQCNQQAGIDR